MDTQEYSAETLISAWAVWGVMLLVAGGLVLGLGYGSYLGSDAYEASQGPSRGAVLASIVGGIVLLVGLLVGAVAAVAKGVQLGHQAARESLTP